MMLDFSPYASIVRQGVDGRLSWFTLGIKVDEGVYHAIRVWVPVNWLEQIPYVQCAGIPHWLKDGEDWHANSKTGNLCFEYDRRWFEIMTKLANEPEIAAAKAAEWIVTSTSFLLYVHHRCYTLGETKWPETIPSWEHSDPAALIQLREMNQPKKTA